MVGSVIHIHSLEEDLCILFFWGKKLKTFFGAELTLVS